MSSGQLSAPSRALRWFPWAAITVLLVVRLCHEWFGPDIWYHLALGERIARTGVAQPADALLLQQPSFVNVYWLFQLLGRGVFALGGLVGVSALFIACWFAAFAIWMRTTGAWRSTPWGFLLALGAVLVCQTRFEERPEVFSFLFLALQIHALATWDLTGDLRRGPIVRFVLVQVLWANVHGYFVLGPLLVTAKLVSVVLDTPRAEWSRVAPAWRGLWLLAALTLVATIVSPFGVHNWSGVLALWKFFGAMRHEVQEFLPPTGAFMALWTVKLFWLGSFVTAIAAIYVLFAGARRETFALLLAAAGLWLSATSFRNIPLLIFFAAPLAGVVLTQLSSFRWFEKSCALAVAGAALAFAAIPIAGIFGPSSFGIRPSPVASPLYFTDYLRAHEFRGTLFNHPGDGGYLEFHFPALRLYGDSRYVETEPVHDYFAALHHAEAFRALDARHHFDAALFKLTESRVVLVTLISDPRWRLAYADLHRALLVNSASPIGAAMRVEPLSFYRGEDLAVRAHGEAALQWAGLFAEANKPDDLLRFLTALSTAPRLPAPVLETALRYGLAVRQPSILVLARTLRPKMIISKPADAVVVDRLLEQAATP